MDPSDAYRTLIGIFPRISDMVGRQLYRPFVESCEEALCEGDYTVMSTLIDLGNRCSTFRHDDLLEAGIESLARITVEGQRSDCELSPTD
jgi:hypothetical protein